MGTLYIDRKGYHLKLDGESIAFYLDGKREGIVPVRPLDRVVIAGNNTIETSVLNKLADNGCCVLFLSGRGLQYRGTLFGRIHNNGILRVKQYEKSLNGNFTLTISKEIILEKIKCQGEFLGEAIKIVGSKSQKLAFFNVFAAFENIADGITSRCSALENLRGYEGAASNAYFSAFTALFPESLGFKIRTRRPPKDPVNAMLSLCYTLVHYEAVREIQVAGLDPTIGFYHCFDYGRESLACDLIETIRPVADRFVWEMFKDRKYTSGDFVQDNEGVYLKKDARKEFYPVYEGWVETVRRDIAGKVRNVCMRVMDGKDTLPE
ncbi:MAG: CRISPR-associated endonuclease Cas1 [Candidatus Loosdrechtia sp.]|uniref:CRISPR-associated endonuclease Cas1 n=1 Tax=Candidatus Loosdrechtia sp. TaxID=3101272 RepID=UPI003A5F3D4B|nr:MAG: CRISPR-associated endonuclease Cas1 [Candidatus Jettenia sp. AMX2]